MAGKNQNFLRGALSLSIATVAVKVIGALYKVPIQNLLGAEGSGLYNVAYNIYAFLFVLATAGLPVAISKMVSESTATGRNDTKRIFSVAFILFLGIGSAGALFMFFGADWLASLQSAEDAAWAIRAVAPSVFLIVFICPYRGVCQGLGDMKPTAVSQVIEAFGKLLFGTGLTFIALTVIIPSDGTAENARLRNATGSAMAILGVSAGILFSAVYLVLRNRRAGLIRSGGGSGRRRSVILKEMISVAIPITLGSAVISITNLIDSGLTRGLLVSGAGFGEAARDRYHGAYTWALTLFNLPGSFVLTLAVSLLPAIAAYRIRRDNPGIVRTTRSAFAVTALMGMPAGMGFVFLAKPILSLLYSDAESVGIAAPLLQVLGIAVIFVCIVTVSNSVLQSMGMVYVPIVTMAIGSAVKLICTYTLVSDPDIQINGAPIGTVACFVIVALLNLTAVIRVTGAGLTLLKEFLKPLVAAVGMGLIALGNYHFFHYFLQNGNIAVILAMGAGLLSYFILLILIKGLPKRDLELLPGGMKLAKILRIQ
ncbi:MAG: polysaccharide biosynthesis protein [Oscillospiraceae bacterium]|jgi:stage V sporulation protein B|nr:polysaccharide biosynthesis protein [Oscillospiraceae bacterium]